MATRLRPPQARRRKPRPSWSRRAAGLLIAGGALYLFAPGVADRAGALTTGLLNREQQQAAPTPSAAGGISLDLNTTAAAPSDLGPAEPRIGKRAPSIRVPDLEGRTLDLDQLRGKVVLLNFWASWCKPCEAEMVDLQAIHVEQRPRGFTVIGLNEGEEPTRAAEFLQAKGITFPTGLDLDMRVTRDYQVFGLPNTFLIDAEGVVRDRIVGPLTREQMRDRVVKVLDGQTIERPRLVSVWVAMSGQADHPAGAVLGTTITLGDVNRRVDLENVLGVLRGGIVPDFSTDEGRARLRDQQLALLERIIDERTVAARARTVGLTIPDEEVAADVRRIAGETGQDAPGLEHELAALGSSLSLLEDAQRQARLIGTYTLEYVLNGRTTERIRDPSDWLATARGAAGASVFLR